MWQHVSNEEPRCPHEQRHTRGSHTGNYRFVMMFPWCWAAGSRNFVNHCPSLGASVVAQLVKNRLQWGRPGFDLSIGKISWRKERLPILVFCPAEFHGLYSPWNRKQLDTTEWFHFHFPRLACLCTDTPCSVCNSPKLRLFTCRDVPDDFLTDFEYTNC